MMDDLVQEGALAIMTAVERFYAGLMQAVMKRMRTEQMKYMGSKAIEKLFRCKM